MNLNERSPSQSIRDLVPMNSLDSPEGIKNLPHLQRVAGLVYLLLEAKSVNDEQFKSEFEKFREPDLDEIQISFTDFVLHQNPRSTFFISKILKGKNLPEIIVEKLNEHGNPFGFGPELTRAILEMANDELQVRIRIDSRRLPPDSRPNPMVYFEHIMVGMFDEGYLSGLSPFSNTRFPAGTYYREIFPKEVVQQMQGYIKQIFS